jgi:uncharacterized membrane protein (UPF0127 family)
MKILYLFLGILTVLIIVFIEIIYFTPQIPRAEIDGHTFSLYLAKTSQEQEVGLAKFNKIEKNQGMLFIFPKSDYYSFWMKNMKFSIDIIFINKNQIVDIFKNVPFQKNNDNLPIYTTREMADKVLEINSGLSKEYKIKIGDKVDVSL